MRWPTAGGGGVLTSPSGKTGYMKHKLNLTMTMPLHTAMQTGAFSCALVCCGKADKLIPLRPPYTQVNNTRCPAPEEGQTSRRWPPRQAPAPGQARRTPPPTCRGRETHTTAMRALQSIQNTTTIG